MVRGLSKSDGLTTRDVLIEAASAEFNESGFHGTDTNRIARRAGYAPQTFYRHFRDKIDVFLAVYARWQENDRREILHVLRSGDAECDRGLAVAAALLESHRRWRVFRRSLRLLAVEDERVRAARARSRRAQLGGRVDAKRVAALLTVERLCDAAADKETDDLGVDARAWREIVAAAVRSVGEIGTADGADYAGVA